MDGSTAGAGVKAKRSWAFMAEHMPRVIARIKEARERGEGAHVDECWRRGVVGLEPGWFYAYEGGVAVGVPDAQMLAAPDLQDVLSNHRGLSMLVLRRMRADAEASRAIPDVGIAGGARAR